MNMAKRPVPRYDFKAFGAAIKAARLERKESRKKVCDEMYLSPRYLANIENKGQHPSLQIFFELMLRYNISVDQFLLERPTGKNTQRRQLDALLDGINDNGLQIVTATAKKSCRLNRPNQTDRRTLDRALLFRSAAICSYTWPETNHTVFLSRRFPVRSNPAHCRLSDLP